jgi:hypothetical protein
MKELELLKRALYEAEDNAMLSDQFQTNSKISGLVFDGKIRYEGDSKIHLDLNISLPAYTQSYITKTEYKEISEDQFSEASKKIQNALQEVSETFATELKNKLASYGLIQGGQ